MFALPPTLDLTRETEKSLCFSCKKKETRARECAKKVRRFGLFKLADHMVARQLTDYLAGCLSEMNEQTHNLDSQSERNKRETLVVGH